MPKRNQLKDETRERERARDSRWQQLEPVPLPKRRVANQTDSLDRRPKRQCTDDDDDNEKQAIKHKLTAKNESGEIYLLLSRLFLSFLTLRLAYPSPAPSPTPSPSPSWSESERQMTGEQISDLNAQTRYQFLKKKQNRNRNVRARARLSLRARLKTR